jgi:hypothetical protein
MFSSSKVELPKKRRCITRYLVPDVSTQPNVLIFKRRTAQEEKMHHNIFGSRPFNTTECSHLQASNCPRREDASQYIWFPTFRHNGMFSSSTVAMLQYPRRIFLGDEDMTNTLSQNSAKSYIPTATKP